MKKRLRIVKRLYIIIIVFIIAISFFDCIEQISVGYETGFFYIGLSDKVIIESVLCAILVFLHGRIFNVILMIVTGIQMVVVALTPLVCKIIDDITCMIGEMSYKYRFTFLGILEVGLCTILFIVSILFNILCHLERKRKEQ